MESGQLYYSVLFERKIAREGGGGGGGGANRDSFLQGGGGGIHVSVYMHVNVCTMIVQNDNAQRGGTKYSGGGGQMPRPPRKTLLTPEGIQQDSILT